jgi:hypothetical protein
MANELFEGNIASELSLNQAIASGILPAPKYVSALYSVQDECAKVEGKLQSSDVIDKESILKRFQTQIIDWEKSSGLDTIIKKHLTPDRNRIIVFCRNWRHLKFALNKLIPIFEAIFPSVACLQLYSKQRGSENELALEQFSSSSDNAIVLFTIDMVNEGLHGKSINTVILLRETTSPIIFYQQIGRAFSINQEQRPLIIDLVNNFRNIQLQSFKQDYEREKANSATGIEVGAGTGSTEKTVIEFVDETLDLKEILDSFSSIFNPWEECFKEALAFFKANGHLYMPTTGRDIPSWLSGQRWLYKQGKLPDDRAGLLSSIGMNWEYGIPGAWMKRLDELRDHIKVYGSDPTQATNKSLSLWLWNQRKYYQDGELKPDQVKVLTEIVQLEDHKKARRLKERVKRLVEYFSEKNEFDSKGPIYRDITSIRYLSSRGQLPKAVYDQLHSAGVPIEIKDDAWEKRFWKLKRFCEIENELPDSIRNKNLYQWLAKQLAFIRNGELSDDRRMLVEDLLTIYKVDMWEKTFEAVKGHLDEFSQSQKTKTSRSLLNWVYKQRREMLLGNLSAERSAKLLTLKEIDWRPPTERSDDTLTRIFGKVYHPQRHKLKKTNGTVRA